MKKTFKLILAAAAMYILLVSVLFVVESRNTDAGIHSIWDAVWFSLITVTTVGYGDIAPVTPAGRVIGAVFALCSIGVFATLIGLGIRIVGDRVIPWFRLMQNQEKTWYVFHEENEDALALAESLSKKENCAIVFLEGEKSDFVPGAIWLNMRSAQFLKKIKGRKETNFFFMGEDPWANYSRGLEAAGFGMQTYSMSSAEVDQLPENLHLFCREDALSRFYWQEHPLRREEKNVVLIGCGMYGSALLERALLTNVFEPGRTTEYHVFEDHAQFQNMHSELAETLRSGQAQEDRLFFHCESWTACRELICNADRIIICEDSDQMGMNTYDMLKKWYVAPQTIHVRLMKDFPGIIAFGQREKIMMPEFVMKDQVNRLAMWMNNLYNEGAKKATPWFALSGFYRASNIAAADHLIVKVRLLLEDEDLTVLTGEICQKAYDRYRELYSEKAEMFEEIEHRRWMRFSQMSNWRYAPERDNAHRLHPLLIPFDQLSEEEKRKDDFAWELLGRLTD